MARSIFTPATSPVDRKTCIQRGGEISAELLRCCSTQASEMTEVIAQLAYELGCTDETTSARATAIEAMAARIQTICDFTSEYFDQMNGDATIDDLVKLLSPNWQMRNEQYAAIVRRCSAEACVDSDVEFDDCVDSANFDAGVALAVEMMREGETLWGKDRAELSAENREGQPQANFALPYLKRAVAEPALLGGFGAVLSTLVGVGDKLDAAYVQKHAAGACASRVSHRPTGGACLSSQAIADIDTQIARTENARELLLESPGLHDASLVNILEFVQQGYMQAKQVENFDDTWHRLIEADSLLQAAIALAHVSEGTTPRTLAALTDLKAFSDALSDQFDGGGVHFVEHQRAEARPAVESTQKEAVPA